MDNSSAPATGQLHGPVPTPGGSEGSRRARSPTLSTLSELGICNFTHINNLRGARINARGRLVAKRNRARRLAGSDGVGWGSEASGTRPGFPGAREVAGVLAGGFFSPFQCKNVKFPSSLHPCHVSPCGQCTLAVKWVRVGVVRHAIAIDRTPEDSFRALSTVSRPPPPSMSTRSYCVLVR